MVTNDGQIVTHNGQKVYKNANNQLVDKDGKAILSDNSQAMFMSANGKIVDDSGSTLKNAGLMVGSRPAQSGELRTRQTLTDNKGNLLFHQGKRVFLDDQQRIVDENGQLVLTKSGKSIHLDENGSLIDSDNQSVTDPLLINNRGQTVTTGISKGRKALVTSQGKRILLNGQPVFVNGDRSLVDASGKLITSPHGGKVYLSPNGQLTDEDNQIVSPEFLTVEGEKALGNEQLSTRPQLTNGQGKALQYGGKDVFLDQNKRVVDAQGQPVLMDGKQVFLRADGKLVDEDQQLIDENRFTVKQPLLDGISTRQALWDEFGDALHYQGQRVYKNGEGQLINAAGKPIVTNDGKAIYVSQKGELVDKQGRKIGDIVLRNTRGRKVAKGITAGQRALTDADGHSILFNGKKVHLNSNGQLVSADGKVITDNNGLTMHLNNVGEIVNEDEMLVDDERLSISLQPTNLQTRQAVTDQDGNAVKYQGKAVFKAQDGTLVDASGNAILTSDGRAVLMNNAGDLVDADENAITEDLLTNSKGQFVKGQLRTGKKQVVDESGKAVLFDNQAIFVDDKGRIIDSAGNVMQTLVGKDMFLSDGVILDSDNRFVDGTSTKLTNAGLTTGLEKVITPSGSPLLYKGQPVFKKPNGELVDATGVPLRTSDGKKITLNRQNQLVDASGQLVPKDDFSLANPAVEELTLTTKTVDGVKRLGKSDIFMADDGTLVDGNGKAITYKGKSVRRDGQNRLVDIDGNIIVTPDGKPVFMNDDGQLIDKNGARINQSLLTDGEQVLIASDGLLAHKKMRRIGDTDLFVTPEGMIVDSGGKAILYNGSKVRVKKDGSGALLDESGRPVTDKNGNSVYINSSGRLVNAGRQPIDGEFLTTSDGILIDAKGELINRGGKLTKIPGTALYKTAGGLIVDAAGKPVKTKGARLFVDDNKRLVNRYGRPIRYRGQDLYLSDKGKVVDANGNSIRQQDN